MLKPSLFVALLPFLVSIGQFSAGEDDPITYDYTGALDLSEDPDKEIYQIVAGDGEVKVKYGAISIKSGKCGGNVEKSPVKLYTEKELVGDEHEACLYDMSSVASGKIRHPVKLYSLCKGKTIDDPLKDADFTKMREYILVQLKDGATECVPSSTLAGFLFEQDDAATPKTIKSEALNLLGRFQVESKSGNNTNSAVLTELKEKAGKKMLQGTLAIAIIVLIFLIIGFVALLALKK